MDPVLLPYWHTEHDTYKTVFIEIIRAIMCGMEKRAETFSNVLPNFETIVSPIQRKTDCDCSLSGISFKAIDAVVFIKLE